MNSLTVFNWSGAVIDSLTLNDDSVYNKIAPGEMRKISGLTGDSLRNIRVMSQGTMASANNIRPKLNMELYMIADVDGTTFIGGSNAAIWNGYKLLSNDFTCQIVKKNEYCEIGNNDIPRDMYLDYNIILPISSLTPARLPDREVNCENLFRFSQAVNPNIPAECLKYVSPETSVSEECCGQWFYLILILILILVIVLSIGSVITIIARRNLN